MSLSLSPTSSVLQVSFTFDWPGGVLMELTIEGAAAGDGSATDLRELCRMFDNLRYTQSLFTTCAECDRHQVLAVLRRSIERAHQSRGLANINISLKDETGTIRNITVSDSGNDSLAELEEMLRTVSAAYPGHAHDSRSASPSRSRNLSVH